MGKKNNIDQSNKGKHNMQYTVQKDEILKSHHKGNAHHKEDQSDNIYNNNINPDNKGGNGKQQHKCKERL